MKTIVLGGAFQELSEAIAYFYFGTLAAQSLLDAADRQKISDFIAILLEQNKYEGLRKEVAERRAEIERGDVLTHDELWANSPT